MKQLMERNAAAIRKLNDDLHEAFNRKSEDGGAAWRKAVEAMKSQYDGLAFPGGISAAFEKLARGDQSVAETAIVFLEVHPYFFRSQYHATKLTRLLKKLELSPALQKRFDAVLAAAHERKMQKHSSEDK